MKIHTTHYENAFITVAPDTRATAGTAPPSRKTPSVAELQYALLAREPYTHLSDDVIFGIHADRKGIPASARAPARLAFFSKGLACLRASPLAKTYGWGIHFDAHGRIALVGMETPAYAELAARTDLEVVPAMRSGRA